VITHPECLARNLLMSGVPGSFTAETNPLGQAPVRGVRAPSGAACR
jgi:hypothetical protein